jgi:integrase
MKGSIAPRGKGIWRLRYEGPPDGKGRRKQLSATVHGTKAQAQSRQRDLMQAVEKNGYVEPSRLTVAQYMQRWLSAYAASHVRPSTLQGYAGCVRRYIVPCLGGVPLARLASHHIQGMYATMTNAGLSPNTQRQAHAVLFEALDHAMQQKPPLLVSNPANAKDLAPKRVRKEMASWDVETARKFASELTTGVYADLFHLALQTGMRRSELCGLKWDALDLERGQLAVRRVLLHINGKGMVLDQPKTPRSRRTITLSRSSVERLRRIRTRQAEQRLSLGSAWRDEGYVFTMKDGRPADPDNVSHVFEDLLRKHRLPKIRLHDLRHLHATILLAAGVNVKVISERLGHHSAAFTMDTYAHVLDNMQREAADKTDALLGDGAAPALLPGQPAPTLATTGPPKALLEVS